MTTPIRVLHVDDEPEFADLAATFLEREDDRLDVETVTSVSEGLERLVGEEFDCIVSDYDIPGQDGIEFLEAVRDEYPDLPFILYTGKGSEEIASEAISAGVTDYLQKGTSSSQYTVLANRIANAVQQYRSQRGLEASQKRLSLFIDQSSLGVIEWDDNFEFVRMNEAAEDLLGYSEDDLKGNSWEMIVLEENRNDVADVVDELLENKGGYHSVNENVRKDGERIFCEWHNRVVTDEAGDVVAIFSQFQDITERKERERAVEELHRTAQDLMQVQTFEDVAEIVVEAIRDILDLPANAVHLYDENEDALVPVVWTARGEELVGDVPTIPRDGGLAWEVFETGEAQTHDDVSTIPGRFNPDTKIRSEIILPLDSHGVLIIGSSEPGAFDETDVSLAKTLAVHASTALNRLAREQELREERAFIDQALDTIDDIFYVISPDGELRRWNRRVSEVTGYTDDDIGDMEIGDFFPKNERERIAESIEKVLATGRDTIEADLCTVYDERIPYEFTGVRLIDSAGDVTGLVGIGRDISERKEREGKLTRRESLFEAILETSIDGILVVDESREHVVWNQQLIDMWEIPEELIEDEPEELALEYVLDQLENPQEFIDKVEYLYEHPREENRDEIRFTDGRIFGRYSAPVEADDGTYFGRVWFFRDVTEQAEREAEITRQNERLEEFASVVSHDLRNPLNVAQGNLELAREQYDSKHIDVAANAVDRCFALIDDLLTLAREGEKASEVERVELAEICDGCWQNVETADATLVNEVDRTIRADPRRLKQLLENLIWNAVEHGGEGVIVTIGGLDDGFYVADDGPGIPEEARGRVFEHGYSTTEDGTGFGLTIVKKIVEAHDWNIRMTDSEAGGARFEITGVEFIE